MDDEDFNHLVPDSIKDEYQQQLAKVVHKIRESIGHWKEHRAHGSSIEHLMGEIIARATVRNPIEVAVNFAVAMALLAGEDV